MAVLEDPLVTLEVLMEDQLVVLEGNMVEVLVHLVEHMVDSEPPVLLEVNMEDL